MHRLSPPHGLTKQASHLKNCTMLRVRCACMIPEEDGVVHVITLTARESYGSNSKIGIKRVLNVDPKCVLYEIACFLQSCITGLATNEKLNYLKFSQENLNQFREFDLINSLRPLTYRSNSLLNSTNQFRRGKRSCSSTSRFVQISLQVFVIRNCI